MKHSFSPVALHSSAHTASKQTAGLFLNCFISKIYSY